MQSDPIQFEVIRNALVEATEEMAIALRRSAYSTNIKTRADFSCAFFDRQLQPVAQAFTQPVHLGSLTEFVPRVVREYGPENLEPGDAILSNHPYLGGVHLNDITLISPVYHGASRSVCPDNSERNGAKNTEEHREQTLELFGYVANLAHHVDVGGGAPASIGAFREVYQEGIIIPPVKLVRRGEIVQDIFRLVLGQIRSKHETAGDFRAQIAANNTGVRRLNALLERMGAHKVALNVDELLAYTERRTRADLANLPKGTFAADGYVDNDGFTDEPVRLAAKMVIDDNGVLFDLTGSDPQRRAPVNSTYAQTYSACAYVLKSLLDPDIPVNAGFYRLVRIVAPPGTVVNCTSPSPVVGGWETQVRLSDILLKAIAPILPDSIPAGTKAMMAQVGFGAAHPRTGELYAFYETLAGGYGGRVSSDGPDAVQCHGQNTENAPIEETEVNYPVRINRYELVEDSDGAGKHRGGLGLRRDYFFDHEASFTILSDRDRWGPHGLFGGLPGKVANYMLNPDSDTVELGSKVTVQLKPGDVVSFRTCGGGGYGPPEDRDPQLVLRDVRDGKVSPARARKIYGVSIDTDTWTAEKADTSSQQTNSAAK
ncbi:MAG: hydantoinase B/oxoprolinase family protein [Candidatus Poribacteria bacterium]|nr:hydantoinase B/oxoprolinase family protein [Candidatus Poribacteria bacterium]